MDVQIQSRNPLWINIDRDAGRVLHVLVSGLYIPVRIIETYLDQTARLRFRIKTTSESSMQYTQKLVADDDPA